MKTIILSFATAMAVVAADTNEVRLPSLTIGTNTYKEVVLKRRNALEAVMRYEGGIRKVRITNLVALPKPIKEEWIADAEKAHAAIDEARRRKERLEREAAERLEKQRRAKAEAREAAKAFHHLVDAPVNVKSSKFEISVQNEGEDVLRSIKLVIDGKFSFTYRGRLPQWERITVSMNDFVDKNGNRFQPLERRPEVVTVSADDFKTTAFIVRSR